MAWATAFKAAKNVATFIEIVDGVADTALLADEIAKGAMGEDYDPAFRDKALEVSAIGKRVDQLVKDLTARQDDVTNLFAAIEQLDIAIEIFDNKNELAVQMIDKIGDFSEVMASVPTAMTWVQGPATLTKSHRSETDVALSLRNVQTYSAFRKFSGANTGFLSAALVVKGAIAAYKIRRNYMDRLEGINSTRPDVDIANDVEMQDLRRQVQRSSFAQMDASPPAEQRARVRLNKKTKVDKAVDVFSKVGSAVSLGFTIYNLVKRVESRNEAMKEFDQQIVDYEKAEKGYRYSLYGHTAYPDPGIAAAASTLRDLMAQAASLDPTSSGFVSLERKINSAEKALLTKLRANSDFKAAKAFVTEGNADEWGDSDEIGFAFGVMGVIDQYNEMGARKLEALRKLFEDMANVLRGANQSTDPTDKLVETYVIDRDSLGQLERDRLEFERLAGIAGDTFKQSQVRKDDGFVPIKITFDRSLQTLMSKVISEAAESLRNVRFASQLYVGARQILREAEAEAAKVEERNKAAKQQRAELEALVRRLLEARGGTVTQADVDKELDTVASPLELFDQQQFILDRAQALATQEWVASDMDSDPTERFPDQMAATLCLELMLFDLQNAQSAHVTTGYIWLDAVNPLPLSFTCIFKINGQNAFYPCFALEPKTYAEGNDPALSWTFASNAHDKTFRTKLFGPAPKLKRERDGYNAEPGKLYSMRCEIQADKAVYWIDNRKYATATLKPGDVPARGRIGFAVDGGTDVEVQQIKVGTL